MNKKTRDKASKMMSYYLRHNLSEVNGDSQGWVDITTLVSKLAVDFHGVTDADITAIVSEDSKTRYAVEGGKIRANQGHSDASVKIDFKKETPPAILYHGTAEKNIESIMAAGLLKGERHHVHLTENANTAREVGKRYGTAVLLVVDTPQMIADGVEFFRSENNVWLTEFVDHKYISRNIE